MQPFAASTGGDLAVRPGIFVIRLEAEKAEYKVGDRINLRITLLNRSRQHFAILRRPPYAITRLDVLDKAQQPVSQRADIGGPPFSISTRDVTEFSPGQAITQVYRDPERSIKPQEWVDIKSWGYDLSEPGDYTITAIPVFTAFERAEDGHIIGPFFTPSPADRSNAVHVKIVK
jgi:hypothetical protein